MCVYIVVRYLKFLDLGSVRDRNVEDLSGGELQRFACAVVCIQRADVYMFDEPSSYLDVKQRLRAAIAVRNLLEATRSASRSHVIHMDIFLFFKICGSS